MAYVHIDPSEDALNKFNEFKTTNNISAIILNIKRVEGCDQVVFSKNFFQEGIEEEIINSLSDEEPAFIYRKINLNNQGEKIICILYYTKSMKAKRKMLYAIIHKELNEELGDIFETISTEETSDIYEENILKKILLK